MYFFHPTIQKIKEQNEYFIMGERKNNYLINLGMFFHLALFPPAIAPIHKKNYKMKNKKINISLVLTTETTSNIGNINTS